MIKSFSKISSSFAFHKNTTFNFANIIKLTTKENEQNNADESLIRSVNSFINIFKTFSSKSLPKLRTEASINDVALVQETFIDFINSLNQRSFENKLFREEENVNELIRKIKTEKILTNAVECLIRQKSFTEKEKDYITNFFLIISQLFKKSIYGGKYGSMDIPFFREYMEFFNQYIVLMHMSEKLILNYLFLTNNLISTRLVDSSRAYFANQKIVIDYMLDNKQKFVINKYELLPLFTYLGLANLNANYPQKYYQFVDYLLTKLDSDWFNDPMFRNKRFIFALYNLGYKSKKIMNGLRDIMNIKEINEQNFDIFVLSLNSYIQLHAERYENYREKDENSKNPEKKTYPEEILVPLTKIVTFLKSIKTKSSSFKEPSPEEKKERLKSFFKKNNNSTEDIELEIFKTLMPTMFRSSLWVKDFWMEFAEWLDKDKNYKKIPVIQLYTIMDLLEIDKDIIPKTISERLLQSKNHMLIKNNFRIEDVDLVKDYHTEFGDRQRAYYTIQQQIANNLRNVSKISIKTESLSTFLSLNKVHFFLVDILMNEDTIIEINNQMHYIMDEGQTGKTPNLKSSFRKRILEKLGYKFMEFEISLFNEGNHEFLKIIEEQFDQNNKEPNEQQKLSKSELL